MPIQRFYVDPAHVSTLLRRWLGSRISEDAGNWLEEKRRQVASGAASWVFYTSFSAVPRYTGKDDLDLSGADLEEAALLRKGWQPQFWSVDQAARTVLVLALPHEASGYLGMLDQVFETADVGESVALYQSLPLLPLAESHRFRASEGLRSNITSVFNAVALRNPYPAEYFDDDAWNQLVLKATFVGSPLHLIYGLDERATPDLARMIIDYAHERWAAERPLTPEAWRLVGRFADDDMIKDVERVFRDKDPAQQRAGALALAQSPSSRARTLLAERPDLKDAIATGHLQWDHVAIRP